eukprot:1809269-Amphidinium_carterae.2
MSIEPVTLLDAQGVRRDAFWGALARDTCVLNLIEYEPVRTLIRTCSTTSLTKPQYTPTQCTATRTSLSLGAQNGGVAESIMYSSTPSKMLASKQSQASSCRTAFICNFVYGDGHGAEAY